MHFHSGNTVRILFAAGGGRKSGLQGSARGPAREPEVCCGRGGQREALARAGRGQARWREGISISNNQLIRPITIAPKNAAQNPSTTYSAPNG